MTAPREASTLDNIGMEYDRIGEQAKALEVLQAGPATGNRGKRPSDEALIFINLMRNQRASQPGLAIFYGKQAINLLQQVRSNIQGLDEKLQKSFLLSKNGYYHTLADLLIAQGRLPEAEQVLDLEKQQEYSEYVRGEAANTLSPLAHDSGRTSGGGGISEVHGDTGFAGRAVGAVEEEHGAHG